MSRGSFVIKRHLILAGGALLGLFIISPAYSQTKIDPFLGVMKPQENIDGSLKAMAVNNDSFDVFIKTENVTSTKDAVEALGGRVGIVVGDILTSSIPRSVIEEIGSRDEVVFIEAAKPMAVHNNLAMIDVNGNEVHQGVEIPTPLTGANTIIGVVDTGIDYDHPDFKDASGSSRILYVWDQTGSGGTGPKEIEASYGIECDRDDLEHGNCPVRDVSGHGTHITATAAGRNETYGGVAPDANIIVVRYKAELAFTNGYADPVFSTTICEGAYYIFKKASALGLPAVVNLSLGTHIGPHDGTSLFEECLDNLVQGSSGRAIVAAAGNETSTEEYYTGLHAGYDVTSDAATNFVVRNYSAGRIVYIDIWGSAGSDLRFGLQINKDAEENAVTLEQSKMVRPGDSANSSFLSGKISYQINAIDTHSPLNGRPHVGITLTFSDSIERPDAYNFDLLVSGTGRFDAWLYPDKPATTVNFTSVSGMHGGRTFVAGDRKMSLAIPATARNVIGVAAYTTRNKWDQGPGCCQVAFKVGDILGFSSSGPSADPGFTGQKPEIAAPGAMIASARSRDAKADNLLTMTDQEHVLMAGTSMAAPFVSGTIALMFSANPNYTFTEAEHYLTSSAYVDSYVGQAPNDRFGFGKLDILAAIEAALGGGASGSSVANPELNLPNLSQGSPSCEMSPATASPKSGLAILVMLGLAAAGMLVKRNS